MKTNSLWMLSSLWGRLSVIYLKEISICTTKNIKRLSNVSEMGFKFVNNKKSNKEHKFFYN